MRKAALKKSYSINEVSKVLKLKKTVLKDFAREGLFKYTTKSQKTVNQQNFKKIQSAAKVHKNLGLGGSGVKRFFVAQKAFKKLRKNFNEYLKDVRTSFGTQLEADLQTLKKARYAPKKAKRKTRSKRR
jgi:hypothetical protein